MGEWEKKKVLITVKTYPTPSTNHHETVCTAGITSDKEWIRLYPVTFRTLKKEQQFEKYTWIECDTQRNSIDSRPESYKINPDTIKIIRRLDSQKDLEERKEYILPLIAPSFRYILSKYDINKTSLGIFKPSIVDDFIITPSDVEWTEKQQTILDQQTFDKTKPLEKIPYDFSFSFKCYDDNKPHVLKTTDWEVCQTYRHFKQYYHDEKTALDKLKEKYLNIFSSANRESYLIVGSVHRWPTFIVIGYFSYSNKSKDILGQQRFF